MVLENARMNVKLKWRFLLNATIHYIGQVVHLDAYKRHNRPQKQLIIPNYSAKNMFFLGLCNLYRRPVPSSARLSLHIKRKTHYITCLSSAATKWTINDCHRRMGRTSRTCPTKITGTRSPEIRWLLASAVMRCGVTLQHHSNRLPRGCKGCIGFTSLLGRD